MENIVSAIYEIHCDALLIKNEDENLSKPLRQNYCSKQKNEKSLLMVWSSAWS